MPTVAPLDLEGHVLATHFLGDIPFFATAAGTIHRLDGGEKVTEAHQGLLTCIRDPHSATLLTGGEDGRVLRIGHDGSAAELAVVPRKWINVVAGRSEEHTSELQSLMRISYAVFCLKKKNNNK